MPRILPLILFALSICNTVFADLKLRIIDVPQKVWIFSPLFLTAELRNNGGPPVLVSVDAFSAPTAFEIKSNDEWKPFNTGFYSCGIGSNLIWLKPGESYFFQYNLYLATQNEGIVEVRAALRGSGECQQLEKVWPRPSYPIKKIRDIDEGVVSLIECWEGSITSEAHKIKVEAPDNESERKILAEALEGKYSHIPNDFQKKELLLAHSFSTMLKMHPKSHYTYVAALYAPPSAIPISLSYSIPQLLKFQPGSALTPYARQEWILEIVSKWDDPNSEGRLPAVDLAALKLPPALEKYVKQKMAEKESQMFWRKEELKQDIQGLW